MHRRIRLSPTIVLLQTAAQKFTPFAVTAEGLTPTRGYNKRGVACWRTYRSVEDACVNLGVPLPEGVA